MSENNQNYVGRGWENSPYYSIKGVECVETEQSGNLGFIHVTIPYILGFSVVVCHTQFEVYAEDTKMSKPFLHYKNGAVLQPTFNESFKETDIFFLQNDLDIFSCLHIFPGYT